MKTPIDPASFSTTNEPELYIRAAKDSTRVSKQGSCHFCVLSFDVTRSPMHTYYDGFKLRGLEALNLSLRRSALPSLAALRAARSKRSNARRP